MLGKHSPCTFSLAECRDMDGFRIGQPIWNGKVSRPKTPIWPKDKMKWRAITIIQLGLLIYVS